MEGHEGLAATWRQQIHDELVEFRHELLEELKVSLHAWHTEQRPVFTAATSEQRPVFIAAPSEQRPVFGSATSVQQSASGAATSGWKCDSPQLNRSLTVGLDAVFGETSPKGNGERVDEGASIDGHDDLDFGPECSDRLAVGAFAELQEDHKPVNLGEDEYDVSKFYKTEGLVQRVVRAEAFNYVTMAIVLANAIYIGFESDNLSVDEVTPWGYVVCNQLFCAFFVWEISMRFAAFARKRNCLLDAWFNFDSFLVILMMLETWLVPFFSNIRLPFPTSPLRLFRLARLSRFVRLFRQFPELVTMVKGMSVAGRSVASILGMLLLSTYVFGIIMNIAVGSEEVLEEFSTLPGSMWALVVHGIFLDDIGALFERIMEVGDPTTRVATFSTCLVFIMFAAITVMNMLIGVLCEVVCTVAQLERDGAAVALLKKSILQELRRFDLNNNGRINKEELDEVMKSPATLKALTALDVNVEILKDLHGALFNATDVPIEGIMELLLHYRGGLTCTVKHIADAQVLTRWDLKRQMKRQARWYHKKMEEILHAVAQVDHRAEEHTGDCGAPVQGRAGCGVANAMFEARYDSKSFDEQVRGEHMWTPCCSDFQASDHAIPSYDLPKKFEPILMPTGDVSQTTAAL